MVSDADADATAVTDTFHENSWSANLEEPRHSEDRDRVIDEAIEAVERTAAGYHVNLVSHGSHGHPEAYLFEPLNDRFGDRVDCRYVDQCGCGGHVTRVTVTDAAT